MMESIKVKIFSIRDLPFSIMVAPESRGELVKISGDYHIPITIDDLPQVIRNEGFPFVFLFQTIIFLRLVRKGCLAKQLPFIKQQKILQEIELRVEATKQSIIEENVQYDMYKYSDEFIKPVTLVQNDIN